MAHTFGLLLGAVLLLGLGFARWRRGRAPVSLPLGLGWTLWWAELGLTVVQALAPASLAPPVAPAWTPRRLEMVDQHVVPEGLGAGPSASPTVVFVGDSFTAGQGVFTTDTLPAQVGRLLGPAVRVVSLASPGWNLPDELFLFGALGPTTGPEAVVWVFVYNDLGVGGHEADDLVVQRGWPRQYGVHLVDTLARLDWAQAVQARTVAAYHKALDPQSPDFQRGFAQLQQVATALKAAGVRPIFVPYPLLHQLRAYPFEAEHQALLAAAAAAGWQTVDVLPDFTGRNEETLWASRADHHPNAEAHAIVARHTAAALQDLPPAAPLDCAALPAPEVLAAELAAACADPGPEGLLRLAEAVLALPDGPGNRPVTFQPQLRAADLAVVATHRAPPEAKTAVQGRAVALVRRARERAASNGRAPGSAPPGPTD